MKIELSLLNCFWLMLPLLAWNLVLGPHITQEKITSDAHSPAWLLLAENVTRILTFAFPLLLPLGWNGTFGKIGLAIYLVGTLVYFASWLPHLRMPVSNWSASAAGLLAPRLTPLIPLLGVALIARFWPYGMLAALFVFLHTWHGIQNLNKNQAEIS